MNGDMGCTQVQELAPELALGIAVGEERDLAIRHLATCQDCRRTVSHLSAIGDDLLLLAPEVEPPPGLSDRVLAGLARPARRPRASVHRARVPSERPPVRTHRPRVRALLAAAAVVVAVAVGAGAVFQATSSDRRLAADYRSLLDRAGGSFFLVTPLEATGGGRVGTVFVYEGNPSWVYVTMDRPTTSRSVAADLVMRDGSTVSRGSGAIGGTNSAWGYGLQVPVGKVRAVRFLGADGSRVFEANLDSPSAVRAGWVPPARG